MWRSKKFIIAAVLAAVLLAGSIGGVVLAADNGDDSQPKARCGALLDKVCEIYNANPGKPGDIDCDVLKAAFAQARNEMRPEALQNRREMGPEAMQNRLQNLVDEGKITQGEADQYKAWLQARPDMEQFRQQLKEWQRPDTPPELKEWWEARPDVPVEFGFRGHGRFPGWAGPCMPPSK